MTLSVNLKTFPPPADYAMLMLKECGDARVALYCALANADSEREEEIVFWASVALYLYEGPPTRGNA